MYTDLSQRRCSPSTSSCSGDYEALAQMFASNTNHIKLNPTTPRASYPSVARPGPTAAQHFAVPAAVNELCQALCLLNYKGTVCVLVDDFGNMNRANEIHTIQDRNAHAQQYADEMALYVTDNMVDEVANMRHPVSNLPPDYGVHLGNGPMHALWYAV